MVMINWLFVAKNCEWFGKDVMFVFSYGDE
jgi:hypothetical protein